MQLQKEKSNNFGFSFNSNQNVNSPQVPPRTGNWMFAVLITAEWNNGEKNASSEGSESSTCGEI